MSPFLKIAEAKLCRERRLGKSPMMVLVFFRGFFGVQVGKPGPALGYIKYVGPKVQKNALNDALIKFGVLKDLDINRQKVSSGR